jgi:EAL domain-containing protein (putative c-di-GMP-specific phosphodiesterase class I)/DNA-binding CsgD family transcriptional regulator
MIDTADVQTVSELRNALERDEIVPYFQSVIELGTGRLLGFEALARWPHDRRGMVNPADFIPIAEASGLIGLLTDNMLSSACAEAMTWNQQLSLSVNVPPSLLRGRSMLGRVRAATERTGLPLQRLVLEITESALMEDVELARATMLELRALGVRMAIDDFGSGYSSLRRLQTLPFDKLKLDADFIQHMAVRPDSRKIVAAMIELGRSLGLTTVAEGIETQVQADVLLELGCDAGQGWLYGRPASAVETAASLATGRWTPGPGLRTVRAAAAAAEPSPSLVSSHVQVLYDSAPVGLAYLDRDMRFVTLNNRLAEMLRLPVEEHIGRTVAEALPDLASQIEPGLARSLQGEAVADMTIRIVGQGPDGTDAFYAAACHPVRDHTRRVIGVSLAVTAIGGAAGLASGERSQLTPRQLQVLRLAGEGLSVKEIARDLSLSVSTVKLHLATSYAALGARNRIEALRRAGFASTAPERWPLKDPHD